MDEGGRNFFIFYFLSLWCRECGISSNDWEYMNWHASSCILNHLTTFHTARQFMYSQSLDDIPQYTRHSVHHIYEGGEEGDDRPDDRHLALAHPHSPATHRSPHQTTISIPLCLDGIPHCTLVYVLSIAGGYPKLYASLCTLNHWTISHTAL